MSTAPLYIDQRPVLLGPRIGRGGEGEVYRVDGDHQHALKIYTLADTADREQKISTMIRTGLAAQAPEVAFPLSVARTARGQFAGFLMKLVRDHKALHELYSPGSRKLHFPQADYRFIVRTALNIARAVASVHRLGCVIGDINHSSILVSREATVTLIDSDSFQVADGQRLFACRVGVPEYTPPELQGVPLGGIQRTANHDAFGLAIVIFQMLFMGRHPFIGSARSGELPALPEAIRDFRFVYSRSRDSGMDRPPGTPALTDFPASVMDGFEAAFGRDTRDRRPAAQDWVGSLEGLEKSLTPCTASTLHWYPAAASRCLWCAMDRALDTTLFVPYIPPAQIQIHPFDPGADGFNLAEVWRAIERFPAAELLKLAPALAQTTPAPSAVARATRTRMRRLTWLGTAYPTVFIVELATGWHWLWLPGICLLIYAILRHDGGCSALVGTRTTEHRDVEDQLKEAVARWRRKVGIEDIERLLERLREAKAEYANLANEEREETGRYHRERRSRQLHAFLAGFEIRRASIRGIGPDKQAALASYGIETAADVSRQQLLRVPGIGHIYGEALLSWRDKLEARFVYSERPTEEDRQELTRISTRIKDKGSTLRRTLLAGRSNLDGLATRAKSLAAAGDPEIARLHATLEQLRADIEHLGAQAPRASACAPTRPPSHSGAGPSPSTQAALRACPRCGSSMVLRQAYRGRWAGRRFWGCSRYPLCNGTRRSV